MGLSIRATPRQPGYEKKNSATPSQLSGAADAQPALADSREGSLARALRVFEIASCAVESVYLGNAVARHSGASIASLVIKRLATALKLFEIACAVEIVHLGNDGGRAAVCFGYWLFECAHLLESWRVRGVFRQFCGQECAARRDGTSPRNS